MIKFGCCIPGGSLMPEGIAGVPETPVTQMADKCRFLLKNGYDFTECGGGMLYTLTDEEADALVEENNRSSLGLLAVNSLFPGQFRLADPDYDKTDALKHFERIAVIMERLGIRYAVLGSGGSRRLLDVPGSRESLYDFIHSMARIAEKHGASVVIEPLRKLESNVFNTIDETAEIVRELNDENVLLLYDAFHMAEEKTPLSLVKPCSEKLRHCHIAEAPNRSYPGSPDSGDPEYLRGFARELKECGYEGGVSVECGFGDFKSDAVKAIAYLREIFGEKTAFEYTPVRDMNEEPVFIKPSEGTVYDEITSVSDGTDLFPASKCGDGIIAVITAKRGEKLTLTASSAPVQGNASAVLNGKKVEVSAAGHRFGEYVFDPAINKPFFGPVLNDAGESFTRLDLTAKEHPHQRSVFIAVGDVNGVDCWNEYNNFGYVRNEGISDIFSGSAYATFTAHNRWTDKENNPLIYEDTKYTVYNQTERVRVLDIEVKFTAKYGKVTFGPTKEAGPLGIRLRDELREDIGSGTLRNSWGGVGEGECWSRSAEWCDYFGKPEGLGCMGVTVFDNEKNERHPTAWHIRSYGLFAANNLYFKGGFDIPENESITYRFRVLFRTEDIPEKEISDRYIIYTLEK